MIRHELNEFLLKIGGHIGYGVVPEKRRKGYATSMLQKSLSYAKNIPLDKVLITCDEDNFGSIKVIENWQRIRHACINYSPIFSLWAGC